MTRSSARSNARRPSARRGKAARSPRRSESVTVQRGTAAVFAALGDETRLTLLSTLARGERLSITRLAEPRAMTRQAVTKHLRVLERASLVRCVKSGRESLFEIQPDTLRLAQERIAFIAGQWDDALARLKASLETQPSNPATHHTPTKPLA